MEAYLWESKDDLSGANGSKDAKNAGDRTGRPFLRSSSFPQGPFL